ASPRCSARRGIGHERPLCCRTRRQRRQTMREAKLYLDGSFSEGVERREVRSPYTNEVVGVASFAGPEHLERALASGKEAEHPMASLSGHERRRALRAIASGIAARAEELTALVCDEAGKPIRLAK